MSTDSYKKRGLRTPIKWRDRKHRFLKGLDTVEPKKRARYKKQVREV